ncbi:cleft lip and palate transmembrane 1, partial [Ramicandelaber brevisporus]
MPKPQSSPAPALATNDNAAAVNNDESRISSESVLTFYSKKKRFDTNVSIPVDLYNEAVKQTMINQQSSGEYQLYAHLYVTSAAADHQNGIVIDGIALHTVVPLIIYQPRIANDTRKLVAAATAATATTKEDERTVSEKSDAEASRERVAPVPHWRSQVTAELIRDTNKYLAQHLPRDVAAYTPIFNAPPHQYLPIFWVNPLGLRRDHQIPFDLVQVNKSDSAEQIVLPLTVHFSSVPLGWFRMSRILHDTFSSLSAASHTSKTTSALRMGATEADNMASMFFDADPTLVAITMFASFLHLLFEALAFKEDVGHWQQKGDAEGVSVSSMGMSAVAACLTLLYVWDNRAKTSVLIVGGKVAAAIVAVWKLLKVMRHAKEAMQTSAATASENKSENKDKDDGGDNDDSDDTKKESKEKGEVDLVAIARDIDSTTIRYLSLLSIPLLGAYATYSLLYLSHRSFYSWALDALMASVHTLDFISMLPQLILNHRLKSVEALPLKAFTYKALNTFVDDLFTFVMPMTTMTRISAFRDDIVFVILLIQWWIY